MDRSNITVLTENKMKHRVPGTTGLDFIASSLKFGYTTLRENERKYKMARTHGNTNRKCLKWRWAEESEKERFTTKTKSIIVVTIQR